MRRLGMLAAALALLAFGALEAAWGQTFPRDDTGVPAPPCVWRSESTGALNQCSDANPLPMASAGGPPATSDPTGWGRRLFSSTTVITGGLGAGLVWQDDQTLIAVGAPGLFGANTYGVFRSSDRGATWGVVAVASASPTPGATTGLHQVAGTGIVIVTGNSNGAGASIYRGSLPAGPLSPVTGSLPAGMSGPSFGAFQQGSTILVAGTGTTAGFICRSTDQVATISCVQPAVITGNFAAVNGIQRLASPALNIWLALDNGRVVYRSTDDGATWTAITTLAGVTGQGMGIVCVSSTQCVAAVRASGSASNIFRSVDAGLTWTQVATSQSAPVVGFLNYGDGIVVGVLDPFTANTTGLRSSDAGATWQPLGPVSPAVGGAVPVLLSTATRAGRGAVAATAAVGSAGVSGLYTVALGAGDVGLVGPNGVRLDINSLGHGGAYQGSGAVNSGTLEAWQTTPVQRGTLSNSETTGAANTAVVRTVAALASARAHLYRLDARCSAGTAQLTVQDGATTIWSTVAAAVTTAQFATTWAPGLTGTTNTAMTVTLSTCGVGNTGTLTVQADRF